MIGPTFMLTKSRSNQVELAMLLHLYMYVCLNTEPNTQLNFVVCCLINQPNLSFTLTSEIHWLILLNTQWITKIFHS